MDGKQYLNAFVNNSATIRDVLKDAIEGAPHKLVTYDSESGQLIVPASEGDPAIGIILSDTPANSSGSTPAGTEVDVLIKNIGLAGAEVKKGDLLTAGTGGKVKKAEDGNYIFGIALTGASADGELVQVLITHSGCKGGSSSGTDLSAYQKKIAVSGILKGDGNGGITAATAGEDYTGKVTVNGILKGDGNGGISKAAEGTDYQGPSA